MGNSNWKDDLKIVIDDWSTSSQDVVLSADVDGLLSCALLATRHPTRVLGVYTTTHLVLLDGATSEDAARALWLDHDVSEPGVRCIGQHLVHHSASDVLPRREKVSFNPNVWKKQSWDKSFRGRSGLKRDKYPYGTCHFLADFFGVDPDASDGDLPALLAHADGTWRTVVDYAANASIWFDDMFSGNRFLETLRKEWHSQPDWLSTHAKVVVTLVDAGVSASASRARIAALLPPEQRGLTGRQSIRYSPANPQNYIDKIRKVLDYIAAEVGSSPSMGRTVTSTISGTVETPYPNTLSDFDDFMERNKVFSHAFTDLRTLRYTTGIVLSS